VFLVPCLIAIAAISMAVIERLFPGRELPEVEGFALRSAALNSIHALLVIGGGLWLQPWLESVRPWSADSLGTVGGAIFGYLVVTFVYYWWHRARHQVGWLWRLLHQVHHSPQRLEVHTSFYKHPLEAATNVLFGGLLLYVVCGLDPQVAQWTVLFNSIAEFFYHWNVRTPRWMGWLLQRPEAHCAHHEEGATVNYSDLPLWDWMFGTLDNPRRTEFACGIPDEDQLLPMLAGVDLRAPRPRSPWRYHLRAGALVVVGLSAMAGDVSGLTPLFGAGLATGAAPAPKVFTSRDNLESFSATYVLEWEDASGTHQHTLDPQTYSRLKGPYNRRNVYGAALAGGPILNADPVMQPMLDEVVRYAFCGDDTVLEEMGIHDVDTGSLRVRVFPQPGHPEPDVPLIYEVSC